MKKYELYPLLDEIIIEPNKLYVKPLNGKLEYAAINRFGKKVTGILSEKQIGIPIHKSTKINELKPVLRNLLSSVARSSSLTGPAKFFIYPFATGGDRAGVPDDATMDGSMSYEQGFTPPYEGDYPTDPTAIPIPREQTNQYLYDITLALQQYQTEGFPDFITTIDNEGTPYPYDIYAVVRYDPGTGPQLYQSMTSSNIALPTDDTKWHAFGSIINPVNLASVSLAASQSISSSPSKIQFDTNDTNFNSNAWWDPVNFRFTPKLAGFYNFNCILNIGTTGVNTNSTAHLYLYKNGAIWKQLSSGYNGGIVFNLSTGTTSSSPVLSGLTRTYANGTTDFFEIFSSSSGGAVSVGGSTLNNEFSLEYLGDQ